MKQRQYKNSVQVRFSDKIDAALDRISEMTGLSKADLIRRALEYFIDEVERTGKIEFIVDPDILRKEREKYDRRKSQQKPQ